jgi:nucleoporin p58/p45
MTSQPAQSGSIFGGAAAATSQTAQPSGGLFSRVTRDPPAIAQTGGGLFGSTTTTPAPTASGGLFGSSTTTTQPAPGGGLFGGGATTTPSTSGGLFGGGLGTSQAQTTAASAGGGIFGGALGAAPRPSGGLFGNSTTTSQPSTGGGLFGSTATQQQTSAGSGLFGAINNASTNQQGQQQTVPAVRVDASNIKPTTRFSELHEEVQQLILQIDSIVQASIEKSFQCSEVMPKLGAAVEALPGDVELLETKLETVDGALSRDAQAVGASKEVTNADALDALRVFRAVENLKLPAQFHYSSIGGGFNSSAGGEEEGSTDLLPYFSATTNKLTKELDEYKRVVVEVESHLRTVEGSAIEGIQKVVRRRQMMNGNNGANGGGAVDARKEGLRELAGTMRGFEEAVLRVAGRVGETREGVVELGLSMGRR